MKRRGWHGRTIYVRGVPETLFVDSDGTEYVRARPRERPDRTLKLGGGLPPLRLRLYSTSAARRLRRNGGPRGLRSTPARR